MLKKLSIVGDFLLLKFVMEFIFLFKLKFLELFLNLYKNIDVE